MNKRSQKELEKVLDGIIDPVYITINHAFYAYYARDIEGKELIEVVKEQLAGIVLQGINLSEVSEKQNKVEPVASKPESSVIADNMKEYTKKKNLTAIMNGTSKTPDGKPRYYLPEDLKEDK